MSESSQQSANTLEIQKLFIQKQSCQVPHAPGIFQQDLKEVKPETSVEMNLQNRALGNEIFEVTLTFHITMKWQQQTALSLEITQAGIFKLMGFDEIQRDFLLGAYCPGILYPYVRKAISDLTQSAGFLPITLPPIDFNNAYQQRQKQQPQSTQSPIAELTPADAPWEKVTVQ
ncbi:MAG: protein-export chaperone SecB [Proteobacteria bacterium]|nr:protein-export chaperone SecB [Pseudomonadota bacterium]